MAEVLRTLAPLMLVLMPEIFHLLRTLMIQLLHQEMRDHPQVLVVAEAEEDQVT